MKFQENGFQNRISRFMKTAAKTEIFQNFHAKIWKPWKKYFLNFSILSLRVWIECLTELIPSILNRLISFQHPLNPLFFLIAGNFTRSGNALIVIESDKVHQAGLNCYELATLILFYNTIPMR